LTGQPARPFFLSVGFEETHRPFPETASDEAGGYLPIPPHLPDTSVTRRDMAGFAASARRLDQAIGRVLDALETAALAGDTLVICTTDHGPAMPGMKCTLTDRGTGVMLILRGPGDFQGGHIVEPMVSQLDLYPTICDLLDIPRPDWLQGQSLLPLIRGETNDLHDVLFAEVTYHAAYEPQRSARTSRFKYIRRFGDRSKPVLPNIDDSLTKDEWLAHGGRRQSLAAEGLYDLFFDPLEMNNLAGDPAYAESLIDMRQQLDDWMEETEDPLRDGPVSAPPGARVNKVDALSPSEPTVPA
jgi:arylsulfatase A-like enzyme